jgi:putative ABC transport system ATP-binding protein
MKMQAQKIVLEGRGIGRIFGKGELAVRALTPTDVQIQRGVVTVIIGPSGSGKTTLLSMLGLVLTPTEGEVWLHGKPVPTQGANALATMRRDQIGFVFQQFNLLPGLTAAENVEVPLLFRGTAGKARRAKALQALALVGLAERGNHKPRSLSGGQQQRVAIARALVTEAPILLCDEPTASLDGKTGRELLAILRSLASETQRAVVIVTHDDRVLPIADHLIEVVDGVASERTASNEMGGH